MTEEAKKLYDERVKLMDDAIHMKEKIGRAHV